MEFMNYSMRLNSQLPLHTRKVFAEHHLNSVKLMKDLNGMWQNQRISLTKLAQKYNINPKQISIAYNTWQIFMLGRFKGAKYCGNLLENKEAYRRRFAEINFSRASFMRVRNNTKLSDRTICTLYGIPPRQATFIRKIYKIPHFSTKEIYQRKMITEYKNNEIKYGKGIKNSFQIPSVKKKIQQTNLRKYGTKTANQNPKVRKKAIQTLHQKYGKNINNPFQIPSVIKKIQIQNKHLTEKEYEQRCQARKDFQNINYILLLIKKAFYRNKQQKVPLIQLPNYYPQYSYNDFYYFYVEHYDLIKPYIINSSSMFSQLEKDFIAHVLEKKKLEFKLHSHLFKNYSRYHVDFYLPKYKLAIELNPAYTHQQKDSFTHRFDKGSRNWKFNLLKKQKIDLLNLYSCDFEDNFDNAHKKLNYAINRIEHGKHIFCDNIPYAVPQNKIEKRRKIMCYNEGYTWWQ